MFLRNHKVSLLFLAAVGTSVLVSPNLHAEGNKAFNPFLVKPFKVPERLTKDANNYRGSWKRVTGFELSGLHWNQFIVVYTNLGDKVYRQNYLTYIQAYEEDAEEDAVYATYPEKTIFIKENYSGAKGHPDTPLTLTTMIKREAGYDTENGNWEYIQSLPNGKIIMQGKASDPQINQMCGSCHINMSSRDYIFSSFYSEQK